MSYNLPIDLLDIDSSGDLNLTGDVTANAFIGDGSQLTNLPAPISSNPFDQELNTTDSPTFVDGDFSGTVTTGVITSEGGNGNLLLQREGTNKVALGGSFIQVYDQFRPASDGLYSNGTSALRWSNVYSVDGSFSGNLNVETGGSQRLYDLGTDGDTDTRFGGLRWNGNYFRIGTESTGAGGGRDVILQRDGATKLLLGTSLTTSYSRIEPNADGSYRLGADDKRWTTVYSVDGDFSGDITVDTNSRITNDGYVRIGGDSGSAFYLGANLRILHDGTGFYPNPNAFGLIGKRDRRFAGANFVDGSFTGNLDVETGSDGLRFFSTGTNGDTDTAFLNVGFDSGDSAYKVATDQTGAGILRQLWFDASQIRTYESGTLLTIAESNELRMYGTIVPSSDGLRSVGSTSKRFGTGYFVDGLFSGELLVGTTAFTNGLYDSEIHNRVLLRAMSSRAFTAQNTSGVDAFNINTSQSIVTVYNDLIVGNNLVSEVGGSYRLYSLGAEGDTDTEYLDISANSNRFEISPKASGSGVVRELLLGNSTANTTTKWHGTLIPFDSGSSISMSNSMLEFASKVGFRAVTNTEADAGGCLETIQRFSSGVAKQTWAYDGSIGFYGNGVASPCDVRFNITNDGNGNTDYERVRLNYSGTKAQLLSEAGGTGTQREFVIGAFGAYQISMGTAGQGAALGYNGSKRYYWSVTQFAPFGDNLYNLGASRTGDRWKTVFAVDGSFGGDLNVEAGGTYNLYNLGAEGDTDTEYLDISWQANNCKFKSQTTGNGVERRLDFEGSGIRYIAAGITVADISAGDIRLYNGRTIRPLLDNGASVGKTGQRFTNVYSYDGDFSGTVTAAETFRINRTINDASTVFQVFDANITDTASDANSNLLNLKVDGVQKFRVKKDGTCTATAFVGDGSGLTNLPAAAADEGEDYTWTGENTFDGDVVMAANVDFTGLPTSDPNTEGRLYNDSGTVKVSSGGGGAPPP